MEKTQSSSYKCGLHAEKIVIDYLQKKNYQILCNRYKKIGYGEIDIIAANNAKQILLFIEVKSTTKNISIEDFLNIAISQRQINRNIAAAEYFIGEVTDQNSPFFHIQQINNWRIRHDMALVINHILSHWIKDITS